MRKAREAIHTVSTAAERSNKSLSSLQEAAGEITALMGGIQSITEQTNLLALNATIEAARAGEADKGFAVVASEVKALTNQTARATEDLASRIQTLQSEVDRISANVSATKDAIETGETTLNTANDQIETAGVQMNNVVSSMAEVAQILDQQQGSAREISSHVSGMANPAKENSSTLDEISASMQESNDQLSESATKWFKTSSGRSLCQMAKIDHVLYKKRVVDTVLGRNDWKFHTVPDDHNCRFGEWYDNISDPGLQKLEAFQSLKAPHHNVHATAAEALKSVEKGDNKGVVRWASGKRSGIEFEDWSSHKLDTNHPASVPGVLLSETVPVRMRFLSCG